MENQLQRLNDQILDSAVEQPMQSTQTATTPSDLNLHIEKLKLEQNLPLGFVAGLVACILGAILWATITIVTGFQIGYMAVAVGLLVGYAIRYFGKGIDTIFGILGSVLSLAGCLFGNFLSIVGFTAKEEAMSFFDVLPLFEFNSIPQIMIATFSPMDLLFYGFAIYEGYKFSFRDTTNEVLTTHSSK